MTQSNRAPLLRGAIAAGAPAIAGIALAVWGALVSRRWFEHHVFQFYFVDSPRDLTQERAYRITAIVAGALLVALGVALGRSVAKNKGGAFAGAVVRYGVALLLAFGVSEVFVRHVGNACGNAREVREAPLEARIGRLDPHYGWVYLPSRTTELESGKRKISFSVNAKGFRSASSDFVSDPHAPTILFAGESIAVGHGLEYAETFAAIVGDALHEQSINLAMHGYGSDQAFVRLHDALSEYEHVTDVVTVFVPAQLQRNTFTFRSFFVLGSDGALVLEPSRPQSGPSQLCVLRLLCTLFPYHDDHVLPLTAAILRATVDAAHAHGATPLFVVPSFGAERSVDDHLEGWLIHALFDAPPIPYVLVDLDPAWHIEGDAHPDARAAKKIADVVTARIQATR